MSAPLREARLPRALLIVVRAGVLAAAGSAVVGAIFLTAERERREGGGPAAGARYVCPMHPEVTSPEPADCPICWMALEAKRGGAPAAPGPSGVTAGAAVESGTFTLPEGVTIPDLEEHEFGDPYETARELRGPAEVESSELARAVLFRDEIASLAPAEAALFFPSVDPAGGRSPGLSVVRVDEPPEPRDGATAWVRVRAAGKGRFTPGQTGWVQFAAKPRAFSAVPESAVVRSPEGPYVWLAGKGGRTFTAGRISVGSVAYDQAAVLAGLKVGERVVSAHVFALEVERRLAGASVEPAVTGSGRER